MAAMRWFHVEHHAARSGDWPDEELYEMERWSLAALSGFQDIVQTVMTTREAERPSGTEAT